MGADDDKDEEQCDNQTLGYAVGYPFVIIILVGFGWGIWRCEPLRNKIMLDLKESLRHVKDSVVNDALNKVEEAKKSVNDVKDSVTGAPGKVKEAATDAANGTKKSIFSPFSKKPKLGGDAASSVTDAAKKQAEDAQEKLDDAMKGASELSSDIVDKVEMKPDEFTTWLCNCLLARCTGPLSKERVQGAINVCRFLIVEVLLLISLLFPCNEYGAWEGFKAAVAVFGILLSLGIPAWLTYKMIKDSKPKFFPGAQTNQLIKAVTGSELPAVLPDVGSVTGHYRINVVTKYQLYLCGVLLGLGLLIQLIDAIIALINGDDNSGTLLAQFFVAFIVKLPEIYMYEGLMFVYLMEAYFIATGMFCPCCACLKKAYDDDDKDNCLGGIASTRSKPPEVSFMGMGNSCGVMCESFFFRYYAWFYWCIDNPFKGFKYWRPTFWPIMPERRVAWIFGFFGPKMAIPYWVDLEGMDKDYAEYAKRFGDPADKGKGGASDAADAPPWANPMQREEGDGGDSSAPPSTTKESAPTPTGTKTEARAPKSTGTRTTSAGSASDAKPTTEAKKEAGANPFKIKMRN